MTGCTGRLRRTAGKAAEVRLSPAGKAAEVRLAIRRKCGGLLFREVPCFTKAGHTLIQNVKDEQICYVLFCYVFTMFRDDGTFKLMLMDHDDETVRWLRFDALLDLSELVFTVHHINQFGLRVVCVCAG